MDFSITHTKASHEDPDFSMANIYSPFACKTEKKKWLCLLKLIYTICRQSICVCGSCFLFPQVKKSWKKQMVSQAIIRNAKVYKTLWYLAVVSKLSRQYVVERPTCARKAHVLFLTFGDRKAPLFKWFKWVFFHGLRFYERFHRNITV